ncbi:MAG TPA: glycosyltransferase family 39 protein [Phototrophicaceae bacterium]|nr:glycosyltransferase family 39 protein [Phototrophicaceae bacterium]
MESATTLKTETIRINAVVILLVGIVILAAALRFYDLGGESYWIDEVTMLQVTQSPLESILGSEFLEHGRPPAYVLLGYAWTRVFGTGEIAARSLSAVLGVAGVLVLFAVGRELFNERIGLIAALLMSLSVFQVFHSQDYRYYALVGLTTLLSYYFFARFLKYNARTPDLILYAIFSALIIYSHPYGVFAVVAQGLYFILQWRRYRSIWQRWLLSQLLFGVLAAMPILLVARSFVGGGETERSTPTDWIIKPTLTTPLGTLFNFLVYSRSYVRLSALALAGGVAGFGTLFFVGRSGLSNWLSEIRLLPKDLRLDFSGQFGGVLLAVLWLSVPIGAAFILSLLVTPMYLDRYLMSAAPALYLLLAVVIVAGRRVVPEGASLAGLIVLMGSALAVYYPTDIKEQWRDTAAYVTQNATSNNAIAIFDAILPEVSEDSLRTFDWYYSGDSPYCPLNLTLNNPALLEAIQQCGRTSGRIWLAIRGDNPERINDLTTFLEQNPAVRLRVTAVLKPKGIGLYLLEFEA